MALELPTIRSSSGAVPNKVVAKGGGKIQDGENPSVAKDSVSITPVGQELAGSREQSTSTAAINEEKVAAISNALQTGHYAIDPERIAYKILQLERQLPDSS